MTGQVSLRRDALRRPGRRWRRVSRWVPATALVAAALLAAALLAGCAGRTKPPAAATPTAGPITGTAPSPATPIRDTTMQATFTPTATPTLLSPAATRAPEVPVTPEALVVVVQNVAQGTYLYEADQALRHGPAAAEGAGPAYQWAIEPYQGSYRLRNQATGHYMSIEHLQDHVELLAVEAVWMSPRWTFDHDPALGPTVIRNVWHTWEVLYTEAGNETVRYGRPPADARAAQWQLARVGGGSLGTATSTPAAALPTPAQPAGQRGARVPWIEYEAEDGTFQGTLLGPDRTFGTLASEASGRRAVQLARSGDYVQFASQADANALVVRFAIPDAPAGGGITATLSLYVDGVFRQKLSLTSRFAWSYGGEAYAFNAPAPGAHHFYDEARAWVGAIPQGARVRLQKDAGDAADYYVVDLVDLEQVGPPAAPPAGYLSITTDCGAVPDDGADDGLAIQTCLDQARAQHSGVWMPPGVFESTRAPFDVADVTVQGAGMWHTTLHGTYARFNCAGNNCRYADFAILGETTGRDDGSPENGFNNGAGSGSRLDGIWVEHTKVGYWVGPGVTRGLIILNSRFRNLFADGVNFASGTSFSVVENSHFRNTGDDALASWSLAQVAQGGPVNTGNVFRFNTVQLPWRANCFALYGGQDSAVTDNLCYDVVTYPGIYVAQSFNAAPFAGTTRIERNTLIRAGGNMYHQEHGALAIRAEQGAIGGEVVVRDVVIEAPTYAGIEIEGSYALNAARFENVTITDAGTWGIVVRSNAVGLAGFTNVTVSGAAQGGLLNYAPSRFFTLERGNGNSGW